MKTDISAIQGFLDWAKVFIKDKGGVLIAGFLIGGGIGFSYYKSEKRVKEYVELRNSQLEQDLKECKIGRETDKDDFLNNMKDVWFFSEQLKNGFQVAETQSRQQADEKSKKLK